MKVYRSAATGEYVTEEYADANPDTTVSEEVEPVLHTLPTVGRIVHYVSYGIPMGNNRECRAALVTEVPQEPGDFNEARVGLAVFNPTGLSFAQGIAYDDERSPHSWHWPCVRTPEEG